MALLKLRLIGYILIVPVAFEVFCLHSSTLDELVLALFKTVLKPLLWTALQDGQCMPLSAFMGTFLKLL